MALDGADRFLATLRDADRVALVTLPNGRVLVNFTTDRMAVRGALRTIVGQSRDVVPGGGFRELAALRDYVSGLAAMPGLKIIVFISEGLSTSPSDIDLRNIVRAAAAARAIFYVIQPNNFAVDAASRLAEAPVRGELQGRLDRQLAGLEDLAGQTGGTLFRLSGTADVVFNRIQRETAHACTLAFAIEAADVSGDRLRVDLGTTRRGVSLRAPREISIR